MQSLKNLFNTQTIASESLVDKSSFRPDISTVEALTVYKDGAITGLSYGNFYLQGDVFLRTYPEAPDNEEEVQEYREKLYLDQPFYEQDQKLLNSPSGIKKIGNTIVSPKIVQDLHGKLLVANSGVPCRVDYVGGYMYGNNVTTLHRGYTQSKSETTNDRTTVDKEQALLVTFHLLASLVMLKDKHGLTFSNLSIADLVYVPADKTDYKYAIGEEEYVAKPVPFQEDGVVHYYLPAINNFSSARFVSGDYHYNVLPVRNFSYNLDLVLIVAEMLRNAFPEKAFEGIKDAVQEFIDFNEDKTLAEPSPISVLEKLGSKIQEQELTIGGDAREISIPSEDEYSVPCLPPVHELEDSDKSLDTVKYDSGKVRILRPKDGQITLTCCNKEIHQHVNENSGISFQGSLRQVEYPNMETPLGFYSSKSTKYNKLGRKEFSSQQEIAIIGFDDKKIRVASLEKRKMLTDILQDGRYLTGYLLVLDGELRVDWSNPSESYRDKVYSAVLAGNTETGSFFAFLERETLQSMYAIIRDMLSKVEMVEEEEQSEAVRNLAIVDIGEDSSLAIVRKESGVIYSSVPGNYRTLNNIVNIVPRSE